MLPVLFVILFFVVLLLLMRISNIGEELREIKEQLSDRVTLDYVNSLVAAYNEDDNSADDSEDVKEELSQTNRRPQERTMQCK